MANFNCAALLGGAAFTGRITFQGLGGGYGSSGAVTIRDAPGDTQVGIVQFTNNATSRQLGYILGLTGTAGGIGFFGGPVGVNTTTPADTFTVNGSAGGTSQWQVLSDERLKQDIQTIPNALELVEGLRGVSFEWRPITERSIGKSFDLPLSERRIGLIAQEVARVVPEVVATSPSDPEHTMSLKEADLVPILVEAIKQQQLEITDLKAEAARFHADLAAFLHPGS